MIKLEIKITKDDGVEHEFKYSVDVDNFLEFIPQILEDFSKVGGMTTQELVQNMMIGVGLAQESIN